MNRQAQVRKLGFDVGLEALAQCLVAHDLHLCDDEDPAEEARRGGSADEKSVSQGLCHQILRATLSS